MSNTEDPNSSPPATTPATTPATAKISSNPTPATPFTPSSSFGKTVLLFDWWLFGAETNVNGRRLAIGGFNTRGQHATRIFNSAPIIKRFDAYTLETADGITVRIQGFINKSRTHHNGIPVEVCNLFLIGFPYNWEVYADEYFGSKPSSTCTPGSVHDVDEQLKHLSDGSRGIFPIQLDEFPMDEFGIRRLLNDLSPQEVTVPTTGSRLGGYSLRSRTCAERRQVHNTGVAEGKDADKEVVNSSSVERKDLSEAFLESDVRNPHEILNGKKHGHTERSEFSSTKDITDEDQYHAEDDRRAVENWEETNVVSLGDSKGSPSNDMNKTSNRILEKLEKCTFMASKDSEAQVAVVNMEKRTSKTDADLLNEPLTKSVGHKRGRKRKDTSEKQNQVQHKTDGNESVEYSDKGTAHSNISRNLPCGIDKEYDMIGKEITISQTNKKLGHEDHFCKGLGRYALRSRSHAERTQVHSTSVAEGKYPDENVDDSIGIKMKEPSEAFLGSGARKPHEILNVKEHDHTVKSKFSLKRDESAALPSAVSMRYVDQYHAEENRKETTLGSRANDISEVCDIAHSKLDKCSSIATKDSNNQISVVDMEKRTSRISACPLKESSTKSIGSRRKNGSKRLKNIQHETDGTDSVTPVRNPDIDESHSNISQNEQCRINEACDMNGKDIAGIHAYQNESQPEDLNDVQQTKKRASCAKVTTIWRPSYSPVLKTPLTRNMAKKCSISSPEELNLKRSQSGRLLVPPVAHWCQEIIYDMEGNVMGITGVDNLSTPTKGIKSPPPMKKKKLL